MAVNARQAVARQRQVGVEGAQQRLVGRRRDHLPVTHDEMSVEVIELEQEAVAVEGRARGEVIRPQGCRSALVKQDDQVAGLPVKWAARPPPASPLIKKMLLESEVPEVLHQDQAMGQIGVQDARHGRPDRFQDPVIAEQG